MSKPENSYTGSEIAIIGLSGRFPGAKNIEEYWKNLVQGVESISFFTDEELRAEGVSEELLRDPRFVKAKGALDDVETFDPAFFDFTPQEAEMMDPQFRILHECAWEALEDSGYDPKTYKGPIGLFAGAAFNHSWIMRVLNGNDTDESGTLEAAVLNLRDYISTLVSYKLNLKGPSYTVQTGCSTSLVSVHLAVQSLLSGECNIALAGGVSITLPKKSGYFYQEGMINSPDGHCRTFDAKAAGTVFGDGAGIVVLKTLEDALDDGDHIYAVIKGSAVNNDGNRKVGYTAPSTKGQITAIRTALSVAEVEPTSISYMEAHGTGTTLGDPIEIEALKAAFGTEETGFCRIGSVKSNIGHLNNAAGVAGLIKAALSLKHKQLPPTLHFETPNPKIDFSNSPFVVNTELTDWKNDSFPLRAGVSSFGIGGTNAHVILEEAPEQEHLSEGREWKLLTLSAKTPAALQAATANMQQFLKENQEVNLADVAYTLQVGRADFPHKKLLICSDATDAIQELGNAQSEKIMTGLSEESNRPVVFMFSGQGSQYANMGLDLYQTEGVFRKEVDHCLQQVSPHLQGDLRQALYPQGGDEAATRLNRTDLAQPALFIFEYALAKLLMSWGVQPQAMIGHSIGEYVAACISGVISLENALSLVALRGKLMQEMPSGSMLSVALGENELRPHLNADLSLAACNGPALSVVSGPEQAIDELRERLTEQGIESRNLHTSHAFHSTMMEPVLAQFASAVAACQLNKPQIPFVSNVTGRWITEEQATDPKYWAQHLRGTVRFMDGLQELMADGYDLFVEAGPGSALSTFVRHTAEKPSVVALNLVRHPQENISDTLCLLQKLGRLWLAGARIHWAGFSSDERRLRVSLPTYSFDRKRYWREAISFGDVQQHGTSVEAGMKQRNLDDWFYAPSWTRAVAVAKPQAEPSVYLLFTDGQGFGGQVATALQAQGHDAITVTAGTSFARLSEDLFSIRPEEPADYVELLNALEAEGRSLRKIVHAWGLGRTNLSADSLYHLGDALAHRQAITHLYLLADHMLEVTGEETLALEKAAWLAAAKHLSFTHAHLHSVAIDIELPATYLQERNLLKFVLTELAAATKEATATVAYRGRYRWVQTVEKLPVDLSAAAESRLREQGSYLLVGGLTDQGLTLAEHLAKQVRARLAITVGTNFPEREQWETYLKSRYDQNDDFARAIRRLQTIEKHIGHSVLLPVADETDATALRQAVVQVEQQAGELNGIICHLEHLGDHAGTNPTSPTVRTGHALTEVLQERVLDFAFLISPLEASLPQASRAELADSCALYVLGAQQHLGGTLWTHIAMDTWTFGKKGSLFAILPEEGLQTFDRLFSFELPSHVIISTGEAKARLANAISLEEVESDSGEALYIRPELSSPYIASSTEMEAKLTAIWTDLFGIEPLGVLDDFFELGGHSLKATTLITKIHKRLDVQINLSDIFKSPTIRALAKHLETAEKSQYLEIKLVEKKQHYPLSSAQKRTYIVHQQLGNVTTYNMPMVLIADGVVEKDRFEKAFHQLIERHETLRTSFHFIDGEPVQVIHDDFDFHIAYLEADESELNSLVHDFIQPFDLTQVPLIRVTFIKLAQEKHALLVDMHNIISDGTSMNVFIQEFSKLYKGEELPALRVQYKEYAQWQHDLFQSEIMHRQEQFWGEQLAGDLPVMAMPLDYPRQATQTFLGSAIKFALSKELVEKMEQLIKPHNMTMNALLFNLYTLLLQQYTDQTDLAIGSLLAGRRHADVENIIGMFTNFLPIRLQTNPNMTFHDFLLETNRVMLESYENQDYPYEKMVEKFRSKLPANRNPFFDTMLIYHNEYDPNIVLKMDGLTFETYEFAKGISKLDFKLDVVNEVTGELKCVLQYNTALFKPETMQRFTEQFVELAEQVVNHPELRLREIHLFSEQELAELAAKRERTNAPNSSDSEQKLIEVPVAVAATFTAEPLSEHLMWWGRQFGLHVDVQVAPYSQVFQELLDPSSLFARNTGANLLLVRFEDWLRDDQSAEQTHYQKLERNFSELINALENNEKSVPYLVGVFPVSTHLGLSSTMKGYLEGLTIRWKNALSDMKNVYLIDFTTISDLYQMEELFDEKTDKAGHIPFTDPFYAAMGTLVARKLNAWKQAPFKVIVLDCDNTLWKGIVGEDGPLGVEVEPGFRELQAFMLKKQQEGMLLALCSKNNPGDVWEVFDQHPHMLLKQEHLVGWKINWQAKSANLCELAEELNLGLDSFIFLDDNPVECTEVMANCPEVLTLQLPKDPDQMLGFLQHVWAFDRFQVTGEDKKRTEMYRTEKQRRDAQMTSLQLEDFLQGIGLKMSFARIEPSQLPRLAQMTQRTNQFNLSTIRRDEQEIEALLRDPSVTGWSIEVADRFGEYGLVGAVFAKQTGVTLDIDTFLLSCRVLGKGVEDAILSCLRRHCVAEGLGGLTATFRPTQKNQPFGEFLNRTGWETSEAGEVSTRFHLSVAQLTDQVAYIECYYNEPLPKHATAEESGSVALQVAAEVAATGESVSGISGGRKNDWDVYLYNTENLVHKNHLRALDCSSADKLLALPTNEVREEAAASAGFVEARTELEAALVSVWQNVLGVERVGIDDNFFELGGNSLLAIKLEVELEKYGYEVENLNILQAQTVRALAMLLEKRSN